MRLKFMIVLAILGGVALADPPPSSSPAETFDAPPLGALRRLGSRQMRHATGSLGQYTPDGRTLFTASLLEIREWDLPSNTLRQSIPIKATNARHLQVTPDGTSLLYDDFRKVFAVDRKTKQPLRTYAIEGESIDCFAISPNGRSVAVGTTEGSVRLFDLATGNPLDFAAKHPIVPEQNVPREKWSRARVGYLAWSPDGATLISSAFKDGVRGWDAATGQELWSLLPPVAESGPVAFLPDGKQFLATYRKGGYYYSALWDAASRECRQKFDFGAAYCAAVSHDGHYIALGSGRVWDIRAQKVKFASLVGSHCEGFAFSADGKQLSCSSSGVRHFDLETGAELFDSSHAGRVLDIDTDAEGKLAVTAGAEGTTRVWDIASGKLLQTLRGQSSGGNSASLAPDGKRAATGDTDTVRVFDLAANTVLWQKEGHSQLVRVRYSPDGTMVAVGGGNLTVHVYDAATGTLLRKLVGYSGGMNASWNFVWTPDSKGIISPMSLWPIHGSGFEFEKPKPVGGPGGEGDGLFRHVLWNVKSGERLRAIGPPHRYTHRPIALDRDGVSLAIGGESIALYEVRTGKELWSHTHPAWGGMAISDEGTVYVGDQTWDAKTGKPGKPMASRAEALAAPAKNKILLTTAWDDNTVVVWPR